MRDDFKAAYASMTESHAAMHVFLTKAVDTVKAMSNAEDLADAAYALREIAKFAEDTEKSARLLHDLAVKMACAAWMTSGSDEPNIKTDYCTATPDVKQIASIPSRTKEPEKFMALMDHFAIPASAFPGADADIVRPHWPGVVTALSKLISKGKPLPAGIDPSKTYPHFQLKIRPKKGVCE